MGLVEFPNGITSFGMPIVGGHYITSGDVYFVHNGIGSNGNSGEDTNHARAALDSIITNKATANKYDHIFCMPGHAENIATTTTVDIDKAGLSIIGLGRGTNRPTFTHTATGAYMDAAAANLTLRNLYFKGGVNSGTVAMLNIAGTNILIDVCEFKNISAALHTDYFIQTSGAAQACDYLTIENCLFGSETTGDCNAAIWLEELNDFVLIRNNIIYGAYDDAGIFGASGIHLTQLSIIGNIVENTESGDWAIEIQGNATGFCTGNRMYTDAFATMLDPGYLKCSDNKGSIAVDQEAIPIPGPTSLIDKGTRYFTLATSFSSATWNTAASHEIATVTGLCRLRIIPQCTTTLVGGANGGTGEISLGIAERTSMGLELTTADNIDAEDIWATSGTTHYKGTDFSNAIDIVTDGDDVGYTVATSALTAGVLTFHIWWEPIEPGATVVAGGGGAL